MPNRTNDLTKPTTKKIPSKVCSSKSRGRVVTSPGTSDDEVSHVSSEGRSSDLESSKGSTCSGDCGKVRGCGRKEKSVSLEF
ncbi:hypothetical protein SS1G_08805 [Sclerotinia sclerotiorum 1980 UF-70]|uniref:Uncharacterized protein n=2 Tax=Sclerotinia sclerotiorum (strain ATCC 18683 / 1980 / Ss-1) TaxID=665079 RepID=A7ETZ8_SCLS1|nr:hypothetical protein SS1G_08805 [Sclerotinia sclerotiorum 1980 UF-70]APA15196.1 hypothetical protein sscle_14g099660 [Sclerotinia sclerotiorum 1980 UF-70]EDN92940.1 hypothetical protein SS1G_08805 [Sclerotinia sclerotiorum 1980 UF-70]